MLKRSQLNSCYVSDSSDDHDIVVDVNLATGKFLW